MTEGKIEFYQPQPEELKDNTLTFRMAVAVTPKNGKDPSYGAVKVRCRIDTHHPDKVVTCQEM